MIDQPNLQKIGWLSSFTFCGCAALRLARFNANIFKVEKNFFQGLPSPAAAAFLASYVLFCEVENFQINIHTELLWCFAGIDCPLRTNLAGGAGYNPGGYRVEAFVYVRVCVCGDVEIFCSCMDLAA